MDAMDTKESECYYTEKSGFYELPQRLVHQQIWGGFRDKLV